MKKIAGSITRFLPLQFISKKLKAGVKISLLFILLQAVSSSMPQKASAQVDVSFQIFYDDLSPYGYWVDNPDYGYVWVPDVSPGFTPYSTNGYWVNTEDGWTWVSNYPWGWAPFHYGRWFYDSYYGWQWVPDDEWSPGWVIWRRSDSYYGWAPIGPGISIDFAYSNSYNLPYNRWRFVRNRDFGRADIYNYYIDRSSYTTIIHNSTVINNFREDRTRNVRYNGGPDRNEAERRAGKRFTPVTVRESNRPGQTLRNNQMQVYRPRVQKNSSAERKPAPSRVVNIKDVKPANERRNSSQQRKENQPNRQQTTQPIQQQPQRQQQPRKQDQPNRQQTTQPIQKQPERQQQPRRQDQSNRQQTTQPTQQQPQRQQQPERQQQPRRQEQPNKQQATQPAQQQPQRQQPIKQQQPIRQEPQRKQQPVTQEARPAPPQKKEQAKPQPVKKQQEKTKPPKKKD